MITDTLAIIPARYGSSRLPGKPLAMLGNEPMVWHVYSHAVDAFGTGNVLVATDDERIARAVTIRGGAAVITSPDIRSGTARCAEALRLSGLAPDIVVNMQADEPFITAADLRHLVTCFDQPEVNIATLVRRFNPDEGFDTLFSPDNVKVVMDINHNALYFSRSIIPYVRDTDWREWTDAATFHIHIGTYAFRPETLYTVTTLPPLPAEEAESLEQLRWLSAGYRIRVAETTGQSIGIDTPADLEAARKLFRQ